MNSNLAFYYIFNVVADTGNISQAAKLLYVSQPAVSKSIKQLEENLETTLFHRSSQGVSLTQEGKILYEHTTHAFRHLSRGVEMIRANQVLGVGHLRIGVSTTLCKHMLLPYIKDFTKNYPHIKITIESQSTSHTLKLLESKSLDIGLVAKPSDDKTFDFISLGDIEDIFITTPAYLDNLMLREHDLDIFSNANIMLLDKENVSRKYIDNYFKENHIEPKYILEVSNMDLLIDFAKTGIGIACVIKEFVKKELENNELIEIALDVPVTKREVGFSYLKNSNLPKSVLNFLNFTHQ